MPENKVQFGLKNVYFAPYTVLNDVITFDTPIPIPGSVTMTNEPRGEMTEFYADDMLYYSADNNDGYDGTLSIANIPEKFTTDVLGEELDTEDGVINELSDVERKPFALLFEFDGDSKAVRHVMYNCSASRPSFSSSTKTNKKEPNTSEIKYIASPIVIDAKKMVKTKTTAATKAAVYDNWYSAVYKKTTQG